jgi:hypothetical protein
VANVNGAGGEVDAPTTGAAGNADDNEGKFDAFDVEVLHNKWKREHRPKYIFRSTTMKRVSSPYVRLDVFFALTPPEIFVAAVFGPTALEHYKAGDAVFVSRNQVQAKIWELDEVTPGALAACAIFVSQSTLDL